MAKVQLHCSPDQPFFAIAVNKSFTRITLPLTTVCKIATTANWMFIENYLSGFCPFGLSAYSLFNVSNTFWILQSLLFGILQSLPLGFLDALLPKMYPVLDSLNQLFF